MKLFTGLKKIREFERLRLPFVKSIFDFDIVIEIGYAEEQGEPLTLKQLFLFEYLFAYDGAAQISHSY